MGQETNKRADLIIAGLGGQGILMGGMILAAAAMSQYRNSLWLPSYSSRVRGGPSECTVVFSDDDIDSPVLSRADVIILVDPPQLKLFEKRVNAGGYFIVESTGLNDTLERKDIRMVTVPALNMAVAMGDRRTSNMILLGVYIGITKSISVHFVEEELEKKFGRKEKVLSLNLGAFKKGFEEAARFVG
ncbi:MAG: 2-oxoacid:acceptor oxidoreductase family protein [Thermodesulfobacteriota bacterium]